MRWSQSCWWWCSGGLGVVKACVCVCVCGLSQMAQRQSEHQNNGSISILAGVQGTRTSTQGTAKGLVAWVCGVRKGVVGWGGGVGQAQAYPKASPGGHASKAYRCVAGSEKKCKRKQNRANCLSSSPPNCATGHILIGRHDALGLESLGRSVARKASTGRRLGEVGGGSNAPGRVKPSSFRWGRNGFRPVHPRQSNAVY